MSSRLYYSKQNNLKWAHIVKPVTYETVFEHSKIYNSKQKLAIALKFFSQLDYIIIDICAKFYASRKILH